MASAARRITITATFGMAGVLMGAGVEVETPLLLLVLERAFETGAGRAVSKARREERVFVRARTVGAGRERSRSRSRLA